MVANIATLKGIPFVTKASDISTGAKFYVDSSTGSDSANDGKTPAKPLATIDYAIGLCTASKGDTIYVMEGHSETLTAAGSITADVAGINIIGLGHARNRPSIAYSTSTAASFLVSAANVWVENIYYDMTGKDGLTAPINVTAADCTLKNLECMMNDASGQCVNAIVNDDNADRLHIDGCHLFSSTNDAGTTNAIEMVGGDDIVIENCVIDGYFTTSLGPIRSQTTAPLRTVVRNNILNNQTGSSTKVVVWMAGHTGHITNNYMGITNGAGTPFTAAAANIVAGNWYCHTAGAAVALPISPAA